MIHNGFVLAGPQTVFMTLPPGALAVVPVKPPCRSIVESEVGCFNLTVACYGATMGTAIALSAITTAADMKDCTAFRKPANPLN